MRQIAYYTVIVLLLIGITNCDPCKRLAKICPIKDSVTYVETVTENPQYTIPDSVYYQLLFYCDSNNQVLLRELENANTGLNAEVVIKKVPYEDKSKLNAILFTLRVSSDSILILNKTIEKLRSTTKTITAEVEKPVKYVPKFYKYLLASCIIFVILVIGYIYLRIKGKTIVGLLK